MSSKTGNLGASVGYIYVGEASLKADDKFIELNLGGGLGVEGSVVLLPISANFEKEYFKTFDLPMNLSEVTAITPEYIGAPSAQEWEDMLSGKGW